VYEGTVTDSAALPQRPLRERLTRPSLGVRESIYGLLFVAPQMLGYFVFLLGPIAAIFWFSLFRWNIVWGTFDFIGLQNYETLAASREVEQVAWVTLVFGLVFVPATVIGGLAIAVAVNRHTRIFVSLRSFYFIPVVIALAAWALVWQLVLQPSGLINGILESLGLDRVAWLRDPTIALLSLIMVNVFKVLGFSMVLFLAALQTVPEDLREAARTDGANDRQVFRSITLPLIAPFTFMVTILLTIASFKSFATNFLLTGGGPGLATTTWTLYIYRQGMQLFEMGYASSLAVVLFIVVLGITIVQFIARRRWVYEGE
jgi:multiple sugar transport system permease protein